MVHIITSRNRLQKPIGEVELDWNNELVKALNPAGVWVHNKVFQRNLVDDTLVTPNTSTSVLAYNQIGPQGILYPTLGASSSNVECFKTGLYPALAHRTVVTLRHHLEAHVAGDFYYSGAHDTVRRLYTNPITATSSSTPLFGWGSNSTGTTASRTAPTAPHIEMLSMSAQGQGASGVTLDGYIDGKLFESRGSISWTGDVSTAQYLLGGRHSSVTTDNFTVVGRKAHIALLDIIAFNPVDAAVHAELALAPWQIVRPARGRIWVPVSAGGAYSAIFTAASFEWTPNALDANARKQVELTKPVFSFTANALATAYDKAVELTAATLSFTTGALSTAYDKTVELTKATLSFTANALDTTYGAIHALTTASFTFTANAVTTTYDKFVELTTATLRFSANALTVTLPGAIANALGKLVVFLRRRRRL